ncbi:hypothetical protein B0T19DRAFT_398396 [Cercophora scortea]|uniref:Uncharacterized protein n=1 Tax=Cercophora scortea TaxID=314031 RepID=A0AAE0IWP5_9PEZI|nr:hypothetical protein B0T19DRAFT_398396 [Cercophora scortea]
MVRVVNSSVSVLGLWKALVVEADARVLSAKRRQEQDSSGSSWKLTKELWKLRWDKGEERGVGPVYEISVWIANDLSTKFNLKRQQSFDKIATTSDDVVLVLRTLWEQAQHIQCDARTRIAFHSTILLASIGGFRPGVLTNFPYENVKQVLCLATLLIAQAISDDAFEPSFSSFEELLQRPNIERTNYLELAWKPKMRTQSIIPLAYHRYRELWNRTVLVSGPLEPAVRNRVLSHTTAVFETSYQPQHLRENLQKLAFQDEGVLENRELFQMLGRALLMRDEHAPIYVFEVDLHSFELRKDIQELTAKYKAATAEHGANDKISKRICAERFYLRETLSSLALEQRRNEYFAEADRRRALGIPTDDLRTSHHKSHKRKYYLGDLQAAKCIRCSSLRTYSSLL